jgi:hypothetical protein
VIAAPVHLFPPLPAYRFRQITNDSVIREDEVAAGSDPPYGAGINYYLKIAPAGAITITILDQNGQVVRTLDGTNNVGINRVHWNLRHDRSKESRLRTRPLHAPDFRLGPEGRPAPDAGRLAILAPPGTYTVKLSVGGRDFTQPLTIIKDPYSEGTEADIQAQMTTLFALRRDMDRAADLVNRIEVARSQVEELARAVSDTTVTKASEELNRKLIAIEQNLVDLRLTGVPGHTWESGLARKLSYLATQLASSDFKPTDQQLEVQKLLEERLVTYENEFKALRDREVFALNQLLQQRKVAFLITTDAR